MVGKVKVAGVGLAILMITGISAQARDFADIYTECGLGAMIAPHNEAVAAVTNVTWDLGTTAISSNVSSPDTCRGGKEKTAAFIMKSYDKLSKELAMGEGKYLDTMLSLAGATEVSEKKRIRTEFGRLVAQPDYTSMNRKEKVEKLYNIVFQGV